MQTMATDGFELRKNIPVTAYCLTDWQLSFFLNNFSQFKY